VATFSCYPAEVFEFNDLGDEAKLRARTAAHRRRYHRAVGVRDVLNACRQVPLTKHNVQVDWAALIERYSKEALAAPSAAEGVSDAEDSDEEAATDAAAAEANDDKDDRSAPFQQAHPHPDLITIGLVGAFLASNYMSAGRCRRSCDRPHGGFGMLQVIPTSASRP